MGLLVIHPGLCTTVQDEGRPNSRGWGVPVGGSFDNASSDMANSLVDNPPDCAVLELTLLGGTFEAQATLAIALTGAPMKADIVGKDGQRRALAIPHATTIQAGERLVLGGSPRRVRTYLAVKGGWQTPVVLGSRSSETRLRAGDTLPARSATIPDRHLPKMLPVIPDSGPIRIVDGPDVVRGVHLSDWEELEFKVGLQSDRMGVRLEGAATLIAPQAERISAPVIPGSIQVTAREVLVLGVACGTMGGYPQVANVITADLDRIGQARPGDPIRFRRIELAEAREIDENDRFSRDLRRQFLTAFTRDDLGTFIDD
jgi:biotin-dependent carboxylase-like uncharacterized protein